MFPALCRWLISIPPMWIVFFFQLIYSNLVSDLKHSTGKDKDIILVPQPSESPRDPLNWPLWKKDLVFLIFCSNSSVIVAWSIMLTPGYGLLAEYFNIVHPFIFDLTVEL